MPLISKAFGDIITFTRASTGSYFDSAGVLQSASINAPRLDYNPSTLAAQGLLIEEQRTNSIRNNTMVGAVAGTPGTAPTNWVMSGTANGITQEIIGVGTQNGVTYIDVKISGTASASSAHITAFEAANQIAAASGQNWAASSYLRVVAGSTAGLTIGILTQARNASNTAFTETFTTNVSPTATLARFAAILTLADVNTAFVRTSISIAFLIGAAIDITLRIGLPQLEQGAFATSVIPTTTAAVTRSADVASVNTLSPWFNATEGTLYAEFLRNTTPAASTFPIMAGIDDGSINNRLSVSTNSSRNLRGQVAIAGVFTTISTANAYTEGVASKLALGYKTLDHAVVANGGTAATNTAVTVPSGLTTLRLGDQVGGFANVNGYLRRITYYPRRLTNAELQAITA